VRRGQRGARAALRVDLSSAAAGSLVPPGAVSLPPLLQAPPRLPVAAATEGASSLGQAAWKYRHPAAARGRAGEGDEALREVYRRVVLYNYSQVTPEALGAESRASGADGTPASRSVPPSRRACVPLSRVAADGVPCPHQL
jgi:hypothetical protein